MKTKELDVMTVTKVGQGTLPKWWRDASGLSQGGVVEVRPLRDGRNSLVLTPKPAQRRGLTGKQIIEAMQKCPHPLRLPKRSRFRLR